MRRWLLALVLCITALAAPASATRASGARASGAARPALVAVAARPALVAVAARPSLPAGARILGPATGPVSGDVVLAPRDPAALHAAAVDAATPGDPGFRRWATVAGFRRQFAPSPAVAASVRATLRRDGLRVGPPAADGLLLPYRGSARAAARAFATQIDRVRLRSGRMAHAPAGALRLPAPVAAEVAGVTGLSDLDALAPSVRAPRSSSNPAAAPGAPRACFGASIAAAGSDGLTATQVAADYDLDPLLAAGDTGAGETVGILDLYGYSATDIATFDDCYYGPDGAAVAARDSVTPVDGGAQAGGGDPHSGSAETELDVEAVNAYAPGAAVDVVEAPDDAGDAGFLDAIATMTDDPSLSVESISYGQCEAAVEADTPGFIQLENLLFEQAAVEGKTVLAASGDDGSSGCGPGAPAGQALAVADPASQPFVTAVGGTEITRSADPPVERAWAGGGGGISRVWPEPAWQAAAGLPEPLAAVEHVDGGDLCGTGACRDVPDVSIEASPSVGGFPAYLGGSWSDFGGTSLASPTWGAIVADIDSTPACRTSGGVGFASPDLYAIASVPVSYAADFDDVIAGSDAVTGAAHGLFAAAPGYDLATGLGAPKAAALASALCAAPAVAPPAVTGVAPAALSSGEVAAGATLTVTGSGFTTAAGAPDVAGVQIGSVDLPAADVTVTGAGSLTVALPVGLLRSEQGVRGSLPGDGAYPVLVTVAGGATSRPGAASTVVLYPSSSGAVQPVVDGTSPSGGPVAGGSVVTVYGAGFAEDPVASVTFGGVAAPSVAVAGDDELRVTTPHAPPASACVAGDHPATGACQVPVVVHLADGTASQPGTIPLEYAGPLSGPVVAGESPAPAEWDYEPAPTVTSVRVLDGPAWASERGGSLARIGGTGLGVLGLQWVDVGPYALDTSADLQVVDETSTELIVALPPEPITSTPRQLPLTAQTFGSPNGADLRARPPSDARPVRYAAQPSLRSFARSGPGPVRSGPAAGGTRIVIRGAGFRGADQVDFVDAALRQFVARRLDVTSDTTLRLATPSAPPGRYALEVCNPTGCTPESRQTWTFRGVR